MNTSSRSSSFQLKMPNKACNKNKNPKWYEYEYDEFSEEQFIRYNNKLIGKTLEIFKVLLNNLVNFFFQASTWRRRRSSLSPTFSGSVSSSFT